MEHITSCNVKCDAVNCVHNCDCYCTAGCIHVGNKNAHTTRETMCDTFKQQEDAENL